MKSKRLFVLYAICLVFLLVFGLGACGSKSGGTIDEPNITTEYLTGDYKEQLLRDGAEEVLGYLQLKPGKYNVEANIQEQKIVENRDYEKGYYVADKNNLIPAWADEDTRIAYLDDAKEYQIMTIEELTSAIKKDEENKKEKLYNLYLMGDQAVLILGTDF